MRDHHIWFLAVAGLQPLDLTGPHEVFATANLAADHLGRSGPRYRLRVVAAHPGPVTTESGLTLSAGPVPAPPAAVDTLVVPGGRGPRTTDDADVLATLTDLAARAERLVTVCTGAFLAARAGLLAGRRVATHWARAEELARRHPDIRVDGHALHVADGPVWSSAGVMAGVDLALAVVEHDHDPEVALLVARGLVVHAKRPGGQSPFASPIWQPLSSSAPVRRAQELVLADPAADHGLERLAGRVGVSPRHLSRLFVAELGTPPGQWVEEVRVEAARRRLEAAPASDGLLPLARACGFASTETLRRAFHRRLGVPPDEYRRRFGPGPGPDEVTEPPLRPSEPLPHEERP